MEFQFTWDRVAKQTSQSKRPRHPQAQIGWKNSILRWTWAEAVSQHKPTFDPLPMAQITIHWRLPNLRDAGNLAASSKYIVDALRSRTEGENEDFKRNLYVGKSYFVDDNPRVCLEHRPEQCVERTNPGVMVRIEPWDGVTIPDAGGE